MMTLCRVGSLVTSFGLGKPLSSASRTIFTSIQSPSLQSAAQSPLAALRKQTGYAYTMCKKALEENNGDLNSARKWLEAEALRHGLQKAASISGRAARHGLVGLLCTPDRAVLLEVNCETDFVAKNDQFKQLVATLTQNIFKHPDRSGSSGPGGFIQKLPLDLDALRGVHEELLGRAVNQLGENIKLNRAILAKIDPSSGHLFAYTHTIGAPLDSPCMLGRSAAIVALVPDKGQPVDLSRLSTIGKQLCQQVLGLKPLHLGDREDVNPAPPPKELPPDPFLPSSSLSSSGKEGLSQITDPKKGAPVDEQQDSDAELDSDAESELIESDTLYDQPLIFDSKLTVRDYARRNGFRIVDFVRIECGESLDE